MSCGAPAALREREREIAGACGGGVVVMMMMMMMMDAQLGRCCLHCLSFIPENFCKTRVGQIKPQNISLLSFSLNKEKISKVS